MSVAFLILNKSGGNRGARLRIDAFREIIKQREETNDEWAYGVEQCWKKEIEILTEDIPSTIDYLKNDCTAEEYSWISEVLDDIVERVPSKELVQCYKELMVKFPEECIEYNIAGCIESAEAILNWVDEHGIKEK